MSNRAGLNIRQMAQKRRLSSYLSWAGAVLLSGAAFVAGAAFLPVAIPSPVYVLVGTPLFWLGLQHWQKANRADQGAAGEEEVARTLTQLSPDWQVEYNLWIDGLGDVDVFLQSPSGRAYIIDVKSHRGEVYARGSDLCRRGRSSETFEKDFLTNAMRQAHRVKELKKLRFVTPVICFSSATVNVPQKQVRRVYVLAKKELVEFLTAREIRGV